MPPNTANRLVDVNIPRLGIAQMNPVVGDFVANTATIVKLMQEAAEAGTELLVLPELALCGYPLGDFSYRHDFVEAAERAIEHLERTSADSLYAGLTVVIGTVTRPNISRAAEQRSFATAHNSAVVIRNGTRIATHHKNLLPNYDVFDDWRNFVPGDSLTVFEHNDFRVAIAICEDIWSTESNIYHQLTQQAVDLVISPNGSPYSIEKPQQRLAAARNFADGIPLLYVNLRGGQDELVFDGNSFLLDADGNVAWRARADCEFQAVTQGSFENQATSNPAEIWDVLCLGLADYLAKTGQSKVVLGLSGGIDSALCAALAVDSIGAENVLGVRLPSRYSSSHSLDDALQLAENLGIELRTLPIDEAHRVFEHMTELSSLAEENLQARLRAVIMMAISNTEGRVLLSTGNKSEIAVGYSTIYGDAAGGFAPIKDVYKTKVWDLARWRNSVSPVIPERSITKSPSAELRPGQQDEDSLPPYELLDAVLENLIEEAMSVSEIVALGFGVDVVTKVDELVRRSEWKRSQGAIGTKITSVSFGRGRRFPIATRFRPL